MGSSDPKLIVELLRKHTARQPKAHAIQTPGCGDLTYEQLSAHVSNVRRQLRELGVQNEDRVAVVLPNGPQMASAFLSIASAAVCAPLNPGYKSEEFEFYLKDLRARIVIVQDGWASLVRDVARQLGIPVIEAKIDPNAAAGNFTLVGKTSFAPVDDRDSCAEDVSLILHTSGTTSRPKIVPLCQANLCASAMNIQRTLSLQPSDKCLNVMPLYHIHGLIAGVLSSVGAGASVVCSPGFESPGFFNWIETFKPTWYTAVPTIHQNVISSGQAYRAVFQRNRLRFVRSSSASLPSQVMAELEELTGAPVVEAYGMTEASHQMCCNQLPPGQRKPRSVGRAAGPEVAVMNAAGELLKAGEVGEVVIRGPNVTYGYEANPEANKKAFEYGWFHTGDEGYFDEDRYLFLTGRIKEMINRAGEKISPLEVDEALLANPAVAQAVTFAVPHPTLGEDVAAAVVLKKGAITDETALRKFVSAKLAEFKVPQRILLVDEIPKGSTGKLQRIGLAAKLADRLASTNTGKPKNQTEEVLLSIWQDVLQNPSAGTEDNYFSIGGDSLQAVVIVTKAAKKGIVFTPNQIFENPTVAGLSSVVKTVSQTESAKATVPSGTRFLGDQPILDKLKSRLGLEASQLDGAFAVTPIQDSMLGNFVPKTNLQTLLQVSWTVHGALDVEALKQVWNEMVHHHDILRTGFFSETGQESIQFILKADRVQGPEWIFQDLSGSDPKLVHKMLENLSREQMTKPMDQTRPCLLRVAIVKMAEKAFKYICTYHHAIADVWTIALLETELGSRYEAKVTQQAFKASEPIPFGNYIEFAKKKASAEASSKFWKDKSANFRWNSVLDFYKDGKGELRRFNVERQVLQTSAPSELSEKLQSWCKKYSLTLGTLLHGVWGIVQGEYTQSSSVILGSIFSGRWEDLPGIDRIVGPTIASAPIAMEIPKTGSVLDWFNRLQSEVASTQPHILAPAMRILKASPWPYTVWNWLVIDGFPPQMWERKSSGLEFKDMDVVSLSALPLHLMIVPESHFKLKLRYNTALFTEVEVRELADNFIALLDKIVTSSDINFMNLQAWLKPRLKHMAPIVSGGARLTKN